MAGMIATSSTNETAYGRRNENAMNIQQIDTPVQARL